MSDLPAFLLARIDEDEAVARAAADDTDGRGEVRGGQWNVIEIDWEGIHVYRRPGGLDGEGGQSVITAHMQRHDPARILAECEAKRRVVNWAAPISSDYERIPTDRPGVCETRPLRYVSDDGEDLLRILALPYADHPDCRDEWRP